MKTWMLISMTGVALMGGIAVAGAKNTNDMASKVKGEVMAEVQKKDADAQAAKAHAEKVAYVEVTTQDVQKLREENPNITIIDARSEEDFNKGHIPGAVLMRPDDVAKKLPEIQKDKTQPIVFYCADTQCQASAKAAHAAKEAGYTNLKRYTTGFAAWKAANQPVAAKK